MKAQMMMEAVAQGKVIEMTKYRCCGGWGAWKPVSLEVALRKARVVVHYLNDFDEDIADCPYRFRFVEAQK